ncbi:MAG: carboxypeptidase regulatory-like domain-containing protein, partial [Bacteroidales bacterium]|nr:carboxypeptidase regulatory-like domain-containing protein [Bacteroidales bacterium]
KLLDRDCLEEYWQKNYKSLLNFILSAQNGFKGTVKNENGEPLKAQIVIPYYDKNNSSVYTDENGCFFRPFLSDKKIEVCAFADGYQSECQEIITPSEINFVMKEGYNFLVENNGEIFSKLSQINILFSNGILEVESKNLLKKIKFFSSDGKVLLEKKLENYTANIPLHNYKSGIYVVVVEDSVSSKKQKIVVTK